MYYLDLLNKNGPIEFFIRFYETCAIEERKSRKGVGGRWSEDFLVKVSFNKSMLYIFTRFTVLIILSHPRRIILLVILWKSQKIERMCS